MAKRTRRKPKGGNWSKPTRILTYALLTLRTATALPTISVKGAKFFTSDGDQFYIKGVVYQPSSTDTNNLTNGPQCELDAPLIQKLGANVVRIYATDPTLNHDRCMKAFEDAGIYAILDMPTPFSDGFYIDRNSPQWTKKMRDSFAQVADGFQKYNNTLGFFVGNEVLSDKSNTDAAPYVKAAIADMKAYRDFMGYREIPIGYAASDIADIRVKQQDYLDCGNSSMSADFYAVNRYSWCGDSSMSASGYDQLYDQADGYDIPLFLSETGCNTDGSNSNYPDRKFTDQIAMLGRQMNDRFSGNVIYEWAQDVNNYGLVSYSNTVATGTPSLCPDYTALSKQWATLTPAGIKASEYNPSSTKRDCPAFTSGTWEVKANAALPTLGTEGLTAPVSTAGASGTASGTRVGAAQNTGPLDATESNTVEKDKKKGVSAGAIAGGVLGGLIVIALLLGVALFFLRRARRRREGVTEGEGTAIEAENMMAVGGAKHNQNGYYGPNYHELSGQGQTQELDPSRGHIATMGANELAQTHRDHELHDVQGTVSHPVQVPMINEPITMSDAQPTAPERSPYVQAQRKLEMNWLESEEARLRQRREALARQNGGDT